MPPTRCTNAPTGCHIFLQDPAERNRSDLEGGVGLKEGEWWEK